MQEENSVLGFFSARLRELMDARELTEEELAAATGVSQSSINRYKKGDSGGTEPKIGDAKAIAKFFGVPLDEFVQPNTELRDDPNVKIAAHWRAKYEVAQEQITELRDGLAGLLEIAKRKPGEGAVNYGRTGRRTPGAKSGASKGLSESQGR